MKARPDSAGCTLTSGISEHLIPRASGSTTAEEKGAERRPRRRTLEDAENRDSFMAGGGGRAAGGGEGKRGWDVGTSFECKAKWAGSCVCQVRESREKPPVWSDWMLRENFFKNPCGGGGEGERLLFSKDNVHNTATRKCRGF